MTSKKSRFNVGETVLYKGAVKKITSVSPCGVCNFRRFIRENKDASIPECIDSGNCTRCTRETESLVEEFTDVDLYMYGIRKVEERVRLVDSAERIMGGKIKKLNKVKIKDKDNFLI